MSSHRPAAFVRQALFAAGFTALGASFALAGGAVAGPGGHGGHGPPGAPGSHFVRIFEDLDLNADQQGKLVALKDEARATFAEHRDQRAADAKEMVSLVVEGKLTRAIVHQRIDDKVAEMKDGMHELGDQLFDMYETLSPTQRAALVERINVHTERMEQAEEHGHRGKDRGER